MGLLSLSFLGFFLSASLSLLRDSLVLLVYLVRSSCFFVQVVLFRSLSLLSDFIFSNSFPGSCGNFLSALGSGVSVCLLSIPVSLSLSVLS